MAMSFSIGDGMAIVSWEATLFAVAADFLEWPPSSNSHPTIHLEKGLHGSNPRIHSILIHIYIYINIHIYIYIYE